MRVERYTISLAFTAFFGLPVLVHVLAFTVTFVIILFFEYPHSTGNYQNMK